MKRYVVLWAAALYSAVLLRLTLFVRSQIYNVFVSMHAFKHICMDVCMFL